MLDLGYHDTAIRLIYHIPLVVKAVYSKALSIQLSLTEQQKPQKTTPIIHR